MPWKESHIMDERVRFISRLIDGERMVDLCMELGISRKTGYKFWERYQRIGLTGLVDGSRRPLRIPHRTTDEVERLVLNLRLMRPTWGPKKLKVKLGELHPGLKFPAASTMGDLLDRHGLIKPRSKRKERFYPTELTHSSNPNDLWCVDFKGQFRLENSAYCYPLTVSDHSSRYLVGCESLENTKELGARAAFEAIFDQFGLPEAIRSDNGAPFASSGIFGLSKLSVWWVRLGIRIEHIEPGCPEQNGRHERMHLTLKEETTRPPSRNHLQQQERFDEFRRVFNEERPHEALDMKTPASIYRPSAKKFSDTSLQLQYPMHDETKMVMKGGCIKLWKRKVTFIGRAFEGEKVGLRQINPDYWLVTFANLDLGYVHSQTARLQIENPMQPEE